MSWFTAKNWSFTRKRKWLKVLSSKIAIISLDKIYFSPKFLQGWRLAPTTPFLSSVMYHGFILKVYIFFFFKKPNTVNFRHSVNRHPPPPLFLKSKWTMIIQMHINLSETIVVLFWLKFLSDARNRKYFCW